MVRKLSSLLAAVALATTFASRTEALPIVVSADATVAGGLFADDNFGTDDFSGGLLTGLTGSTLVGPYRFYLLFLLPAFAPNTQVASATLQGYYNDDWDTFDDRTHSLYQSATGWTESTVTWNNQPGPTGAALGVFTAAAATPGTFLSWDLTAAVNAAYLAANSSFSLVFRADNEALGASPFNNNLEYFASREFLLGSRAFTLDVQVVNTTAVPEPTTLALIASTLACAIVAGRRRRGSRSARARGSN